MPIPEMQPVFSSFIASIGYDEINEELYVSYYKGNAGRNKLLTVYEDVPAKVAADVMHAPSIGDALHLTIRGFYKYKYVEPPQ